MYNYQYVTKDEAKPVKEELTIIIHKVQDLLRDEFTFRYDFIGSSSRNMITCDPDSNIGFDFDVNIEVNDNDEQYSAKEIKEKLMNAFNRVVSYYGYKSCENSTRVFTFKFVEHAFSRIHHSCDVAIVYNYINQKGEPHQQYIRYIKKQNSYVWVEQKKPYALEEKVDWIKKQAKAWGDVIDLYIEKKNNNTNPANHSRSLYAETIHEICQRYGYYNN